MDPQRPPGRDGHAVREWTQSPWQHRAFKATERFVVLPAGRRCGKSEFGVQWILERYRSARRRHMRGTIWIVYPTYDIARVAWRKFKRLTPKGWVVQYHGTELHPQAIIMRGGITIEFKSGVNPGSLVGEGLLAVWIDECGEVRERVWNESIRPTLVDHIAPALLTGTPKGRNWFWTEYQRGWQPEFRNVASIGVAQNQGIPSIENPFIDEDEVRELARDMSQRLYRQEIQAEFLSSEGAIFNVDRARAKGLRLSTAPTVSLGIDLARRVDFTVLVGMDRDFGVTYFDRFNEIDWPFQRRRIEETWQRLGSPRIVIDATPGSVGDPFAQELIYAGLPVEPFGLTALTKRQLVETIAVSIDSGSVTLPDEPVLLNELEAFEMQPLPSGNVRYSAPEGKHDDCVIALGLALHGAMNSGGLWISSGRATH